MGHIHFRVRVEATPTQTQLYPAAPGQETNVKFLSVREEHTSDTATENSSTRFRRPRVLRYSSRCRSSQRVRRSGLLPRLHRNSFTLRQISKRTPQPLSSCPGVRQRNRSHWSTATSSRTAGKSTQRRRDNCSRTTDQAGRFCRSADGADDRTGNR